MKKLMRSVVCIILGAALGIGCFVFFSRLSDKEKEPENFKGGNVAVITVQNDGSYKNSDLVQLAYSIVSCLRSKDYEELSSYVNPEFGLILSPYPNINLSSNQCLMTVKVADISRDSEVRVWGAKDGTDEPIQMTPSDYFSKYVYDKDYINAPVISINQIMKSGNSLENVQSIFPEGVFVDFYIPPSTTDGLDWSILRLVFESCNGTLKLSAIIHSQYTV